jgi:hypothetical protein
MAGRIFLRVQMRKPYQFDPTQQPDLTHLKYYTPQGMNFRFRSPFQIRQQVGLPPTVTQNENITYQGNTVYVGDAPLAPLHADAQQAVMTPPTSPTPPPTISVSEGTKYGDAITFQVPFAAAGDLLVLTRPTTKRTLLIIENDLAAPNSIRVNFDAQASVNLGLRIINGGNLFFDVAVPQNDIHVFAPVAGNVLVTYMNAPVNLTQ